MFVLHQTNHSESMLQLYHSKIASVWQIIILVTNDLRYHHVLFLERHSRYEDALHKTIMMNGRGCYHNIGLLASMISPGFSRPGVSPFDCEIHPQANANTRSRLCLTQIASPRRIPSFLGLFPYFDRNLASRRRAVAKKNKNTVSPVCR